MQLKQFISFEMARTFRTLLQSYYIACESPQPYILLCLALPSAAAWLPLMGYHMARLLFPALSC
jgi:hypothetical protein